MTLRIVTSLIFRLLRLVALSLFWREPLSIALSDGESRSKRLGVLSMSSSSPAPPISASFFLQLALSSNTKKTHWSLDGFVWDHRPEVQGVTISGGRAPEAPKRTSL